MSVKVAVVYHSGYGHTKVVAEHVAKGARDAGADVALLNAEELANPDQGPWEKLDEAHAIIFGAPTYMGSASAPMKAFMDASSKRWFTQAWKDKLAAGFTNSASYSGDKLATLSQFTILAAQHAMVWVSLGLMPGNNTSKGSSDDLNRIGSYIGLMTQANADEGPDTAPLQSDRKSAEHLGRRVTEAAARWNK